MRTIFSIFFLLLMTLGWAQDHKTKNVVILLMDGYRWQELFGGADSALLFSKQYNTQDSDWRVQKYWAADQQARREKLMPFVWRQMARNGQLYGNRKSGSNVNVINEYWFSYPGRSETFCGYYDPKVNSNDYPDNPNENVLEYLDQQDDYKGKVVTFASWDAVARILNRDRNHMLVNIYGEDISSPSLTVLEKEANALQRYMPDIFGKGERPDASTYLMAKAYVQAHHPRVLYIDFGDTDEFAHEGKYDYYLDAAHKTDAMIDDLWNIMQQDPFYRDQTTFLLIADHGRGYGAEWTSHGAKIAHANETYLGVMGPDIPAAGEVKGGNQIYQNQFAQTIASLLGFQFTPSHTVGKAVKSIQP